MIGNTYIMYYTLNWNVYLFHHLNMQRKQLPIYFNRWQSWCYSFSARGDCMLAVTACTLGCFGKAALHCNIKVEGRYLFEQILCLYRGKNGDLDSFLTKSHYISSLIPKDPCNLSLIVIESPIIKYNVNKI